MVNLSVTYITEHALSHRDCGPALREKNNMLLVVTGGSDGNLYLFRGGTCLTSFSIEPGVKIHCLTYQAGAFWV